MPHYRCFRYPRWAVIYLSPQCSPLHPLYISIPSFLNCFPFTCPIYMHHYTLIIFLSDLIKDLKYTMPPPDSLNPHFWIIYALISSLICILYYNTYTVFQISSLYNSPIPISFPCLNPILFIYYIFTFCIHLIPSSVYINPSCIAQNGLYLTAFFLAATQENRRKRKKSI